MQWRFVSSLINNHADLYSGLPWWCIDHLQSVRAAGFAVYFCALGAIVSTLRFADIARHGGNIYAACQPRRCRRRMVNRIESIWPLCGDGVAVVDGAGASVPGIFGTSDASLRCFRRTFATARRPAKQHQGFAAVGCCGRLFMGTLCRADFGSGVSRRGIERRESVQRFVAADIRRRCSYFTGSGLAGRRAGVQSDETRIGRRRMGAARTGRRRADRRAGHCAGLGYTLPVAVYFFKHRQHRAKIDCATGRATCV